MLFLWLLSQAPWQLLAARCLLVVCPACGSQEATVTALSPHLLRGSDKAWLTEEAGQATLRSSHSFHPCVFLWDLFQVESSGCRVERQCFLSLSNHISLQDSPREVQPASDQFQHPLKPPGTNTDSHQSTSTKQLTRLDGYFLP